MLKPVSEAFRHIVTLKDGARMLLRPLVPEDVKELAALYAAASPAELFLLRDDLTDPKVQEKWLSAPDYGHILPLLALISSRIVGTAILYRRKGPQRHGADVQVLLAQDFRGRGLGTLILETLVDLARREGLHWLQADVLASQTKIARAFEGLGFERQCLLENYIMLPDGQMEDLVILIKRLLKRTNDF